MTSVARKFSIDYGHRIPEDSDSENSSNDRDSPVQEWRSVESHSFGAIDKQKAGRLRVSFPIDVITQTLTRYSNDVITHYVILNDLKS